jgi:hypothetical protein
MERVDRAVSRLAEFFPVRIPYSSTEAFIRYLQEHKEIVIA